MKKIKIILLPKPLFDFIVNAHEPQERIWQINKTTGEKLYVFNQYRLKSEN